MTASQKSGPDGAVKSANPLFNDNRLKLGIFSNNGRGTIMTKLPEVLDLNWRRCIAEAVLADSFGLEALVPFARWKGFVEGDPTHPGGRVFDPYIWAAAVAQATRYSAVLATSHVAVVNPILAAKQCATIDHVSGGRFALNVVAGWNIPELEMFGREIKGHDDRYEEADEWVGLLKRLWSSDELFDHGGGSFQLKQAISLPHPLQRPNPPIMNAGGSKRGMHFAAKNADLVFVVIKSEKPANIAAQVSEYRELARREYGREIQVWTFGSVIQRETLADAEAYERYFAIEHGDDAAADGFIRLNNLNSQLMPPEQMEQMRLRFKAGGGFPLKGNAQQIAARLEMLSAAGLDGVLLVWPEPYSIGIQKFGDEVLPLLEQAGLRRPFRGVSSDVGLRS